MTEEDRSTLVPVKPGARPPGRSPATAVPRWTTTPRPVA
jgi:hypothetical protein